MEIDINTKIERWRAKAELFLKENIKCIIKTIDGSLHSADILLVDLNYLHIYDFVKKEKFRVYWLDVLLFEEWKDKGVKNNE